MSAIKSIKINDDNKAAHVSSISVIHENDDAIIIYIDLKTKYAEICATSLSNSDAVFYVSKEEVDSEDIIYVSLRGKFLYSFVSKTSRYSIFISLVKNLEKSKIVWQEQR